MTQYTAVIFDFDGTLADTRPAISATLSETFSSFGLPTPDPGVVNAVISKGVNLEQTFQQLVQPAPAGEQLNEYVLRYREIYNSGVGVRASIPFPDAPRILEQINALGTPVVVVSNKGEESVQKILLQFEMREFVHSIVAARDAYPTKPDPKSYFERIRPMLGENLCQRVLVVGDTDLDIKFAQSIEATACWASYGYGDEQKCRSLAPDLTAASLEDVLHIVRGN